MLVKANEWSLNPILGKDNKPKNMSDILERYGCEDNKCNPSQPKWWDHSHHPRSTSSRGNLEEVKRSLYEKESDEQGVFEDEDEDL